MDPRLISNEDLQVIRRTAQAYPFSSGSKVVLRLLDHIELMGEAIDVLSELLERKEWD